LARPQFADRGRLGKQPFVSPGRRRDRGEFLGAAADHAAADLDGARLTSNSIVACFALAMALSTSDCPMVKAMPLIRKRTGTRAIAMTRMWTGSKEIFERGI